MTEREKKTRIFLRKWHRDIGYFIAGLTIIYSISGVAVNHIDDWNPSYTITKEMFKVDTLSKEFWESENLGNIVMKHLKLEGELKDIFQESDEQIKLFFEGKEVDFNMATGELTIETTSGKPVLKEVNFLHLNKPKKVWTYVADVFAVLLIFLAGSGIFMVRGKNGIVGRGKWIVAAGILIPVIFWILYMN